MAMMETKRAPSATPKDIADRWEYTVSTLAKQLQAKRKQIRSTIGARPYRGVPVNEAELLRRYSQIRHDPVALTAVLKENAKFTADGRALVPKALIERMTQMEEKFRREGLS